MMHVINQKVPSCPRCASGMHKSRTMFGTIYICNDCNGIYRVLSVGQTENEIIVGDNLNDKKEEKCEQRATAQNS